MIISKCCKAEAEPDGINQETGATIVICLKCGKECHYYEDKSPNEMV